MVDRVRITRPDPSAVRVFDEVTGQYSAPVLVTVYEGKCELSVKADINSNVVELQAGEREQLYLTAILKLPIEGSEGVRPDDQAVLLSCPVDPSLVGRRLLVQSYFGNKTYATHRRLRVKEEVG